VAEVLPTTAAGRSGSRAAEIYSSKPESSRKSGSGFMRTGTRTRTARWRSMRTRLTHVCPEWMTLTDGNGTLQVDEDVRWRGWRRQRGWCWMPLLTNLVDDVWQPEAVEAGDGAGRQEESICGEPASRNRGCEAGGWCGLGGAGPTAQKGDTDLLIKMAGCVAPVDKDCGSKCRWGMNSMYWTSSGSRNTADHYIAMLYDETSDNDPPGPIASQDWNEGC